MYCLLLMMTFGENESDNGAVLGDLNELDAERKNYVL